MLATDTIILSLLSKTKRSHEDDSFLYKIPSRRTITRYMDDKYEHLYGMFKREIAQVTTLTLTCDI